MQIDNRTQCGLGATGHHLINRVYDGTVNRHLTGWKRAELSRAYDDVAVERTRAAQYAKQLDILLGALANALGEE